jgi:hypothetical protein
MRLSNRVTILPAAPTRRGSDSFEEERREVLESVFTALRERSADPDEMAACAYLVQHLTREEGGAG